MRISETPKYTNKKDNKQTNILTKFSTSTYRGNSSKIFVCRFVFSGDEERTAKKKQKTPKPYRVDFSSPRGTPKGKKRDLFREDISPPYSALEEPKTTKSASEGEKTNPVYIIYLIGRPRKPAIDELFGISSALRKIQRKNTPRTLKQRWGNPAAVSPAVSLR
jgi:hypothetical protein